MDALAQLASPRIEVADLPWVLSLAHERYASFDPGGALTFALQAINAPTVLAIKGADQSAFLVASTVAPPWYPKESECHVMMLCAKAGAHWQAIRLLRESVAWARLRGCVRWRFHSETRHDVSILCRRVGAMADTPRYVLDL